MNKYLKENQMSHVLWTFRECFNIDRNIYKLTNKTRGIL